MLNESPDRLILPDETIEWQRGVTFFAFKTPAGKSYIAQTANSGADFFLKIGDVDISEPVKVKYREYIKIALDHESLANLIHLIKPDLIKNNTARDEFIFSGRLWKHSPNSFISFWNSKSTVDNNRRLLDKFMKQNGLSYDNTLFEFPSNQKDYKPYDRITTPTTNSKIDLTPHLLASGLPPAYAKQLRRLFMKELTHKQWLDSQSTGLGDLEHPVNHENPHANKLTSENAEMAQSDITKIIDYSEKLQSMFTVNDNLEDWVKAKLNHACDYVATVRDYLKFYNEEKDKTNIQEKWSNKYKKSINCSNPKGFSQKAHCAARRKRQAGGETSSKSVKEYYKEAICELLKEQNSSMAIGALKQLNNDAKELKSMLKPNTQLEDWVKAKLNLAGEYLDDVYHHLDHFGPQGRKLDEGLNKILGLAAVAGSLVGSPEVSANGPVEPDKITQTAKTQTVKTPTHPYTYEDVIASTLVDEAGGEKDAERGMTAVMNVLMNRAKGNFSQVGAECLKPQQFSGWNAIDKSDIKSVKNFIDSKRTHSKFTLALEIVSKARSGELKDITGGADHFLNVALTKKQSKTSSLPSWYDSEKVTTVIGLHTFLKLNSPNKKSKK